MVQMQVLIILNGVDGLMNKVYNLIRKSRNTIRIPLNSDYNIFVKEGESLSEGQGIYAYERRKILDSSYLLKELGVSLEECKESILRLDGEFVEKGELMAEKTSRTGLTIKQVIAADSGVVSYKRLSMGYLDILSEKEEKIFKSKFKGEVKEVSIQNGLKIDMEVSLLRFLRAKRNVSMFEKKSAIIGSLEILKDGDSIYTEKDLKDSYKQKIVFAGAFSYQNLIDELFERGALGVIVYSMDYDDFLGIEGNLVVLGKFGQAKIPDVYLTILRDLEDEYVYLSSDFESRLCFLESNFSTGMKFEKGRGFVDILYQDTIVISKDYASFGKIGKIQGFEEDQRFAIVNFGEKKNSLVNVENLEIVTVD